MRWTAGLVEKDDALGLGRKIERVDDAFRLSADGLRSREQAWIDERIQSHQAQARGAAAEKGAAV